MSDNVIYVMLFGAFVAAAYYLYKVVQDFIDHSDDDVPPGGAW